MVLIDENNNLRRYEMLVYFLLNLSNNRITNFQDINLQQKINVEYIKEGNLLKINDNTSYLKNYWKESIESVTTLVGANGVGKTSILNAIRNFINPEKTPIMIIKKNGIYNIFIDDTLASNLEISFNERVISLNNFINDGYETNEGNISSSYKYSSYMEFVLLLKEFETIYYTNHWNYFEYQNGFNQVDLSIANILDSAIEKTSNTTNKSYLDLMRDEQIRLVLKYIESEENRNLINRYLHLPEKLNLILEENRYPQERPVSPSIYEENIDIFNDISKLEKIINESIWNEKRLFLTKEEVFIFALSNNLFNQLNSIFAETVLNYRKASFMLLTKDLKADANIKDIFEKVLFILEELIRVIAFSSEQKAIISQLEELLKEYKKMYSYLMNDLLPYLVSEKDYEKEIYWEGNRKFYNLITLNLKDSKGITRAIQLVQTFNQLNYMSQIFLMKWNNLSSGETQLLSLVTTLNNQIENTEKEKLVFLLDEIEVALHPLWQKELVNILINSLSGMANKENKSIQIIFATHSPFILSDMPLHSSILLFKEDKNSVTKVQSSLDDKVTTLGANIHELYSNSFFLKDGLIGEYAKRKINDLANKLIKINPLSDNQECDDDFWSEAYKLINQIAEPLIRNRLLNLYNEKQPLKNAKDNAKKIAELNASIEEIKKQIEILKRD